MLLLPIASVIDNLRDVGTQTGFSLQQFIAQCIAFLIMCGFLWKFAWGPVRAILEQRLAATEQSVLQAERIKTELADAESARLSIIKKANDQANGIIAESQKAGAALSERLSKEATAQAQDILRKAHEAAVLDRDRLMSELKRHVGELVIQTTQKVAGKVLTPDDQTRLNAEAIQQINAPNN